MSLSKLSYYLSRIISKTFGTAIFIILFVPILAINILIRFIKPLVKIRFGCLRSDVIGNSSLYVEYYLSNRELNNDKSLDFFYFDVKPPNYQWALMVRRKMLVYPIIRYFDIINKLLPYSYDHIIETALYDISSKYMQQRILLTKNPHIHFNKEENLKGSAFLESIGMTKDNKFICLLVRDSSYKLQLQSKHPDTKRWEYHNYRDSDIDKFASTILDLVKKGYFVFRMGKGKHKPLPIQHRQVIDYPNSQYRSDFLDIWLTANCDFMVSTGAGLDTIAFIFRKPTVFPNFIPIGAFNSQWNILISPKRLFWKKTKKMLNLTEYLQHLYYRADDYKNAGIEIHDSSQKEIQNVVGEMESRLHGTFNENTEDVLLQKTFRKKFKQWNRFEYEHAGRMSKNARIGAHFLRDNKKWLN